MIIVSGHLTIKPGRREAFLAASLPAVMQARRTAGCLDFVVAADPIEADRVNVFERWESEAALLAFRGAGPDGGMLSDIVRGDVQRHEIAASGPP